MGAQINFKLLHMVDWNFILFIIFLVFSAILISFFLGRLFNLSSSLSLLIGVGNGICGSSAIAAVSGILKSKKEDIGISMTVINMVGVLGIFLIPSIMYLLEIDSDFTKGFIAGGTIQAVGQVTAAGFIMGDEVGKFATFIKMIRILMLGPVMILFAMVFNRGNIAGESRILFKLPPFIIGFIVMSVAVNMNFIPNQFIECFIQMSKYALILSMASIGLQVSLSSILNNGIKVIFVSLITFLIQVFICLLFLM